MLLVNLTDSDTDIGELDGHWYWYWWTWWTQLSSPETQSFKACPPELPWGELPGSKPPPALPPPPSTQPGQDQPLHYHELMLKLWNAILPNTQSITSSLSDMKTSNYKGWQKGFVQQGLIWQISRVKRYNHMWWDFVQIDSWPAWWDFYCFVNINSDGGHREFFIGLVWTFHEVNLNLVAIMIYRGWWHWRRRY